MAHTFEELKQKTVAQLKEIAKGTEHDALKGYTTMHKDKLLNAVCTALGIDMHVNHEVKGIDKSAVKLKIGALKKERDKALETHDHKQLKAVRKQIKRLKIKLRRAQV